MFKIGEKEQSIKEKVLQEIMDLMDAHEGEKLGSLKKPAAVAVEVSKMSPVAEEDETPADEAAESVEQQAHEDAMGTELHGGDEPSEDEKKKISELYHKYC